MTVNVKLSETSLDQLDKILPKLVEIEKINPGVVMNVEVGRKTYQSYSKAND